MNDARAAGSFPLGDVVLRVVNKDIAFAAAVLRLVFAIYDIDGNVGSQHPAHPADLVRACVEDASFLLGNSGKNFTSA